jgi:hypothetical protein
MFKTGFTHFFQRQAVLVSALLILILTFSTSFQTKFHPKTTEKFRRLCKKLKEWMAPGIFIHMHLTPIFFVHFRPELAGKIDACTYTRRRIRKFCWCWRTRGSRGGGKSFLGTWSCRPAAGRSSPAIACLDRRSRPGGQCYDHIFLASLTNSWQKIGGLLTNPLSIVFQH